MKILIVSDTHGNDTNFFEVLRTEGEPDMIIHAGDTSGSEKLIANSIAGPVKIVLGNNDFFSRLKYEEEFLADGVNVLLTHGHKDGVYYGTDRLIYKASERGADVVVYGHTHVPMVEYDEDLGIWAVNPGSLSYPRQEGHVPSYIIMTTDSDRGIHFEIKYLK